MNSGRPARNIDSFDHRLVLYYFGELAEPEAKEVKELLNRDSDEKRKYSNLKSFLDELPRSPAEFPTSDEWSTLRREVEEGIQLERKKRASGKRAARFRMAWAGAVYAAIVVLGLSWWGGLAAKPSPLIVQVYGGEKIYAGSQASLRVIARERNQHKSDKELARFRKTYLKLGSQSPQVKVDDGEKPISKTPGSNAGSGEEPYKEKVDEIESRLTPRERVIYEPPYEALVKESWRMMGFVENAPIKIELVSKKGTDVLYYGKTGERGTFDGSFVVPSKVGDDAEIRVMLNHKGKWSLVSAPIKVQSNYGLVLSHDKPRYKPGQTIHMRVLVSDKVAGKAAGQAPVIFEILAPDGTKLYRIQKKTSKWGIAAADFVLADNVALGEYTLKVMSNGASQSAAVTVDNYRVPDIRIEFLPDQDWIKPGDVLTGIIKASYYFGEPVKTGRATVEFSYFDFEKVSAGSVSGQLDSSGELAFSFRVPEKFFLRNPEEQRAELQADVTVSDGAGQTASEYASVLVSKSKYIANIFPEGGIWQRGVDNYVYILLTTVDGEPVSPANFRLESPTNPNSPVFLVAPGLFSGTVSGADTAAIYSDGNGLTCKFSFQDQEGQWHGIFFASTLYDSRLGYSLHTDKAVYKPGDTANLLVMGAVKLKYNQQYAEAPVYVDVVRDGQIIMTTSTMAIGDRAQASFEITPQMIGEIDIRAYTPTQSPEESDVALFDSKRIFVVADSSKLAVELSADKESYEPGETAKVNIKLFDSKGNPTAGAIGISAVDSKALSKGIEGSLYPKFYYDLLKELMDPRVEIEPAGMARLMEAIPDPVKVMQIASASATPSDREVAASQFERAYQILGRSLASRAAPEERSWYQLSRSSSEIESKQINLLKERTRRSMQIGFPAILLVLSLAVIVITVAQYGSFSAAVVSPKAWKQYRLLAWLSVAPWMVSMLPPFAYVGWMAVCAISAAGLAFSVISAKLIGERIDLFRVKAMLLAAAYPVSAAWFVLVGIGEISIPVQGLILALLYANPFVLSAAFLCNNIENPVTASRLQPLRVTTTILAAGIAGLVVFSFGVPGLPEGAKSFSTESVATGGDLGGTPREALFEKAATSASASLQHKSEPARIRKHFPETLVWIPELVVDDSGQADCTFEMADSLTTWEFSAIASDAGGNIATSKIMLPVKTGFFIDALIPAEMTLGDEITVPIAVYNFTGANQSASVSLQPADWFSLSGSPSAAITAPNGSAVYVEFRIKALRVGDFALSATANSGGGRTDAIEYPVRVVPGGKEVVKITNGIFTDKESNFTVQVPEGAIAGSVNAVLKLYQDAGSHISESFESAQQPGQGGFIETSAAYYPSVLVLSYLKNAGRISPEVESRARENLSIGYQSILAFETSGGGFSFYGEDQADLTVTSFGLLDLLEIEKVGFVDANLVKRTQRWLRSQAEPGSGLFRLPGGRYDAMHSVPGMELAVNSYVLWALAASGVERGEMLNAVNQLKADAKKTDNPYALAVAINALSALGGNKDEIDFLCGRLKGMAKLDERKKLYWETPGPTLTFATGKTANVECTSLAVLALLSGNTGSGDAASAIEWLATQKGQDGTWGSARATALALKALVAGEDFLSYKGDGTAILKSGVTEIAEAIFSKESNGVAKFIDLSQALNGKGATTFSLAGFNFGRLFYQLDVRYNLPWNEVRESPVAKPFEFSVSYDRTELAVKDTLRVEAEAKYLAAGSSGAIVMQVGIAPGFKPLASDLDALVNSGIIARWEETGRFLRLYHFGLLRGDRVVVRFRMRALYPLSAEVPQSNVYEIANPESAAAAPPLRISVT
ncbi:MAG: hypothetical protein HRF49_07120 [bacterium]|jgi:hypothetical protein